jgi:hypothetical protein
MIFMIIDKHKFLGGRREERKARHQPLPPIFFGKYLN